MTRFSGKVALVTGASSGIGHAVAERLAEEGARLVLASSPDDGDSLARAANSLRQSGREVVALAGDMGDRDHPAQLVELALDSYGRLDVLISNAGMAYFEEVLSTPVEHFERTVAVNLRGSFLLAVAAAKAMSAGGAIVTTLSTASYMGEEYQVTYNVSKGGLMAMTRSLAIDLASLGVRVNGVAAGWVATRATKAIISDPVQWSKHRSHIPLDRPGRPEEIAAVHAFLASNDASYVTGAVFVCDGGMTAGFRYADWAAVAPPPEGLHIGLPDIPSDMHAGGA